MFFAHSLHRETKVYLKFYLDEQKLIYIQALLIFAYANKKCAILRFVPTISELKKIDIRKEEEQMEFIE